MLIKIAKVLQIFVLYKDFIKIFLILLTQSQNKNMLKELDCLKKFEINYKRTWMCLSSDLLTRKQVLTVLS